MAVTRWQKVKLVVFLVGSVAAVLLLLSAFGGLSVIERIDRYYVFVPESVSGLERGSVVQIRGVRVGKVADFELYPDGRPGVLVELELERGTRIMTDARAYLKFQGLTGLKLVDIEEGSVTAPPLPPGSRIEYGKTALQDITARSEELFERVDDLLASANRLVGNLAAAADRVSGEDVERTVDQAGRVLERADRSLQQIGAAAAELTALLSESRPRIDATLTRTDRLLARADSALSGATQTLESMSQLTRSADRVLGTSGQDLRGLVRDLREASRNLREASNEVRMQPSRLLFSRPPEERELP